MNKPTRANTPQTDDLAALGPDLSDEELECVVGGLTRSYVDPSPLHRLVIPRTHASPDQLPA
jgi:hypothetical protein